MRQDAWKTIDQLRHELAQARQQLAALQSAEARRQEWLTSILEINKRIATSTDLERLIAGITEEACRLVQASGARVGIRRGDHIVFEGYIHHGVVPTRSATVPLGDNLLGQVVHEDRAIIVTDLHTDPRILPENRRRFAEAGMHSAAFIPIRGHHAVLGVLYVSSQQPRQFTLDEVAALTIYAEQAALAMENARLFKELEERTATLERTNADLQGAIAAHQRMAAALQESEARYRALVENSIQSIAVIAKDGCYLFANHALATMFGYEHPADLIGQQVMDRVAPHERARIHSFAMARLRGEPIPARYEYQGVRQNGTLLWIERIASLIPWAGETVFLSTYVDITERKQAEGERERFIAELEAKNAELERFTYTVSHDLKSPLVTIQGFLGLLEQDALAGDGVQFREDITQIATAAETMWHLLEDLLALSRIGRVVNPPQAVAFGELVHEAIALVSGQITRRGVQVGVAPDLPVVWGDRQRLLEVLQNLLDNAVKFMGNQAAPRLQVGARDTDAEMILYVRDNGLGIAPHYHEKVFGLFERLDTASDGTGVGLALARRIVELHGGRIWIESAGTGHGCTVCFTLPRPGERAHHEP